MKPNWTHWSVRRIGLVAAAAIAVPGLTAISAMAPAAAHKGAPACRAVTAIPTPPDTDNPFGISNGPGGVYIASGSSIDVLAHGQIQQFSIQHPATADAGWVAWDGASRYVWFADRGNGRIGTVDARGDVTEYRVPDGAKGGSVPQSLVFDEAAVWFTDYTNGRIGRFDPDTEEFSFYTIPTKNSGPVGMALGKDGDLYFIERTKAKMARLDPNTSLVTEWTLPTSAFPNRLVVDRAGRVWFTDLGTDSVGLIDDTGHLTESPATGGPVGIVLHHGHLFTANFLDNTAAAYDLTGRQVTTWALPGAVGVLQIASRGRSIYVADAFAAQVFRINLACRESD